MRARWQDDPQVSRGSLRAWVASTQADGLQTPSKMSHVVGCEQRRVWKARLWKRVMEFMFHLLIRLYNPGSEVWEQSRGDGLGSHPKVQSVGWAGFEGRWADCRERQKMRLASKGLCG